jgi:hypothetical protein
MRNFGLSIKLFVRCDIRSCETTITKQPTYVLAFQEEDGRKNGADEDFYF